MTSRRTGPTLAELCGKAEALNVEIAAEISSAMDSYFEGRREFYREHGLTFGVEIDLDGGTYPFLAPIDA